MRRLVVVLVLLAACGGERRDARTTYNEALAALRTQDFEQAEKLFLEARSKAGVDPELRFRAAYDLGLAYAGHAEKLKAGENADLEQALQLAQQAATWFGDASRLREGDPDTVANLAIVRARVQAISDELRKSENKLEARLDALIGEQRGLLDDARAAWLTIKQAGGTDPLAQQSTLAHLADRERGIVAEAGTLTDLAADEIDAIGKKPEDKRTKDEQARVVQLKNVDVMLLEARSRITEARRKLQELAAEDGVARAEAALVALKRAREQLLDPIARLQGVAQDQVALLQESAYAAAATGALQLDAAAPPPPAEVPGWMAPDKLAEREGGLRDRVEEVRAGLEAFVASPEAKVDPRAGVVDPEAGKQAKTVERLKLALPSVVDASAAMDRARDALGGKRLSAALDEERAALVALQKAIEQFADLKHTIELAHADQQALIKLLGDEGAKLPAADRAKETRDALARNLARMPRIKELIADEQATLAQKQQQLDQPPAQAGGATAPAPDPKQVEAQKQALASEGQLLAQAETLRGEAETALGTLDKAIAANGDPLTPAKDGGAKIAELRKLFFSVIEHLQQLLRDQGETRDQTSAADAEDQFSRDPKLPGLVDREQQHGELAKAIADALAKQADEQAQQPQQPQQPHQGPDAKALAGAANEVRLADGEMTEATRVLTKARDSKTTSERLDPAVGSQAKAIEHLQAALQLLQPPPKKNDKNDKQQDQQQQQDKQQQQQQQQQSGGARQRAKDQDAERQREKRRPTTDPVDKDW